MEVFQFMLNIILIACIALIFIRERKIDGLEELINNEKARYNDLDNQLEKYKQRMALREHIVEQFTKAYYSKKKVNLEVIRIMLIGKGSPLFDRESEENKLYTSIIEEMYDTGRIIDLEKGPVLIGDPTK